MARQPIAINGEVFKTKAALKERVRAIIARSLDDVPLSGADLLFVLALIMHHRHFDQKAGCGIKAIVVRLNKPYRDRGFWIIRPDGSETDFSWVSCIDRPTQRDDVLKALRAAIRDQIREFRAEFFAENLFPHCPLSGEPLDPDSCHVDHELPLTFDRLVAGFFDAFGLDFDSVPLAEHGDGDLFNGLGDRGIERAWTAYHRQHARLRMLSPKANLSLSRKGTRADDRSHSS